MFNFKALFNLFLNNHINKIFIFFVALLIYIPFSYLKNGIFYDSSTPYFKYLADALKGGNLFLVHQISNPIDLSLYDGKFFLYWPPMPAIVQLIFDLILPFSVTDVFLNQIFAALNGALVMHLLCLISDKIVKLNHNLISLLSIFFVFGTSHFPLSPYGSVWAVSQIYGITFVIISFISVLSFEGRKAALICSFFMGCAFLCRLTLLVNLLWPTWYIVSNSRTRREKLINLLILLSVIVFFLVLYGCYNYLRFGSFVEIGYRYHLMSSFFINDYKNFGAFSLHYVPQNIYYHFIHYPFPFSDETFMGGSLFLLSPLYFYLFRVNFSQPSKSHQLILLLSIVLSYVPLALIMGTGMVQFGSRYLLDFSIPLLILLAFGMSDLKNLRIAYLLLVISVIHFTIGTVIKSF